MYQLTKFGVLRLEDNAHIPADQANTDYTNYLAWLAEGNAPLPAEAPSTYTDPKLVGVEFQGVLCSATKEDMWGLSSVAPWIESGNSTAFEFDNGNVLVLTPENYRAFYEVWASFRASFFNKVE